MKNRFATAAGALLPALGLEPLKHVFEDYFETSQLEPSLLKVARVGIRVAFESGPSDRQQKPRSFELAWPNSCSLQNDAHGVLIQRMLVDLGIEPRRPTGDRSDDNQGG